MAVLVVEIIGLIVVNALLEPTPHSFLTYDATISLTYNVDSTIPFWLAICIPLISLLLSFLILEGLAVKRGVSSLKTSLSLSLCFFLDFVGTGVVTGILTEVTKVLVGRYRPDWLDRCSPDVVNPVEIKGFGLSATDNPQCQSDLTENKIEDGMKSFPSGHASTAFTLGVFVSWYCMWYARARLGKIFITAPGKHKVQYSLASGLLYIWVIFQISWAWGVAISRVIDNKHHESDVISGAFLGTIVSIVFCAKSAAAVNTIMIENEGSEQPLLTGDHSLRCNSIELHDQN